METTKCDRCGLENNGIEFKDKYNVNLCECCESEIKRLDTKKHAEKIRGAIMSMTLRRGFNQDFNQYLNENPKEKQEWDRLNKILDDIIKKGY